MLSRWGLRPRVGCIGLARWRALVDACITVLGCGYVRPTGCLFVGFDNAQILAYFGNLPFLNEDLLNGAIIRAGDLDAGLVALHLTEWLKNANRGSRKYIPMGLREYASDNEVRMQDDSVERASPSFEFLLADRYSTALV